MWVRRWTMIAMALAVWMTAGLWMTGCIKSDTNKTASDAKKSSGSGAWFGFLTPRVTVPFGTSIDVRLARTITSETAGEGDPWRGVVAQPVFVGDHLVIPAGSEVRGVVVGAREARRGNRAMLELQLRSVDIDDRRTQLLASSQPVVAGSPRARNLGAIAGGAAAGALLGKAIGGEGDDAARGAVIGGALATGAVAASKGYQVVLRQGTSITFVLNRDVAVAKG